MSASRLVNQVAKPGIPRVQELLELWRHLVAPKLRPRSANTVSKTPNVLFGELSDDIRRAAEISAKRVLTPEAIRGACPFGFTQVFGLSERRSHRLLIP